MPAAPPPEVNLRAIVDHQVQAMKKTKSARRNAAPGKPRAKTGPHGKA